MDITVTGASALAPASDWSGSAVVYAAAYRELLRVAYVLTGSGPVAEDVVQDVFAKVGPRIATLDDPVPYLRVAVVNRCRSIHRHTVRTPRPDAPRDIELDVGLADLRDAIASLPIRQRTAIVLRYLCDLDDVEIADILKCRRSTVRSHVRRGLAQLREVIR
jgi:RNA polymerase sigma factor (sigma-70 family)